MNKLKTTLIKATYTHDGITHAVEEVAAPLGPIYQSLCADRLDASIKLFDISTCDLGDETLEVNCFDCMNKLGFISDLKYIKNDEDCFEEMD